MENCCKYVWNKKTVTTVFCPTSWWSIVENLTLLYAYIWNEKSKFSYNPWYSDIYSSVNISLYDIFAPILVAIWRQFLVHFYLFIVSFLFHVYMGPFPSYIMYICDSFLIIPGIYGTVSLLFHVYMWQFPYYLMYICDSFLIIPGVIVTVSFLFHV